MSQEAGSRHQEVDNEDDEERGCPGRYRVVANDKLRVLAVGFDGLYAQEQEHPYARANSCRVAAEDEALEKGVEASWEETEGPGEQKEGHNGAVLHFEALEERCQGDGVDEEVEHIFVQQRVGIETIHWFI